MDEIERLVRASLAEHAAEAPPGDVAAERFLADLSQGHRPARRPSVRRWLTPLVAAATVVALVVALYLLDWRQNGHTPPAGVTSSPRPSAPTSPTLAPTHSTAAPVTSAPTTPSSGTSTTTTSLPAGPVPAGMRVADLTFVSPNQGFALGTGQCLDGSGKRCAALLRTDNGGQSWVGVPTPVGANVPDTDPTSCQAPCIEQVRFADAEIGYAYGPSAFFMTTNGGATWTAEPGGADALETLNGTVIRIIDSGTGCPGPCNIGIQVASNGSTSWQSLGLPGGQRNAASVVLTRAGHGAYLLLGQHTSGGAPNQISTLYVSANDGATWAFRGEPCPQPAAGVEVDSVDAAAAPDGSLTIACQPRQAGLAGGFTMTSTDGVHSFDTGAGRITRGPVSLVGAASSRVLFLVADTLYRSTDGGASWTPVRSGPGAAIFIGFETATTGRVIAQPAPGHSGSATVWTTTDAGQTWTPYTFG
jgi:photosystem II stability/assembly factor-like uncharacterized protein